MSSFQKNEPAFSVLYGGVGHEFAGTQMLIQLPLFFLAPLLAVWLLSKSSKEFLDSFLKKVLFFIGIGLLISLYTNLMNFGIADYPLSDALLWSAYNIVIWTFIGLVAGWKLTPAEE